MPLRICLPNLTVLFPAITFENTLYDLHILLRASNTQPIRRQTLKPKLKKKVSLHVRFACIRSDTSVKYYSPCILSYRRQWSIRYAPFLTGNTRISTQTRIQTKQPTSSHSYIFVHLFLHATYFTFRSIRQNTLAAALPDIISIILAPM